MPTPTATASSPCGSIRKWSRCVPNWRRPTAPKRDNRGAAQYRFEWNQRTCAECPLRERCLGEKQKHRTIVVGEHHSALQARRLEQKTPAFQGRMRHRNAIEGTQSELVRAHGLRRARYRGRAKVQLQAWFAAAACNVKRWLRRCAWELGRVSSELAGRAATAMS